MSNDTPNASRVEEATERMVTAAIIGVESATGARSLARSLIAAVRSDVLAQVKEKAVKEKWSIGGWGHERVLSALADLAEGK